MHGNARIVTDLNKFILFMILIVLYPLWDRNKEENHEKQKIIYHSVNHSRTYDSSIAVDVLHPTRIS